MLAYLHPVTGGLVILLLAYAGSLGLRARNDRRRAAQLLARHARLAPWAYWLTLASWAAGVATTWLWRSDLDLAQSNHFRIGVAMSAALIATWLSARAMRRPLARSVHPYLGIAALLLAAAQVFFGLQITP